MFARDLRQRALNETPRANRILDQRAVAHGKSPAHQSVHDLSLEASALVDRISGARDDVLAPAQIVALEVDNGEVGIKPDGYAALAMPEPHGVGRCTRQQRRDAPKRQVTFV